MRPGEVETRESGKWKVGSGPVRPRAAVLALFPRSFAPSSTSGIFSPTRASPVASTPSLCPPCDSSLFMHFPMHMRPYRNSAVHGWWHNCPHPTVGDRLTLETRLSGPTRPATAGASGASLAHQCNLLWRVNFADLRPHSSMIRRPISAPSAVDHVWSLSPSMGSTGPISFVVNLGPEVLAFDGLHLVLLSTTKLTTPTIVTRTQHLQRAVVAD